MAHITTPDKVAFRDTALGARMIGCWWACSKSIKTSLTSSTSKADFRQCQMAMAADAAAEQTAEAREGSMDIVDAKRQQVLMPRAPLPGV
jgi:hypothetical protein